MFNKLKNLWKISPTNVARAPVSTITVECGRCLLEYAGSQVQGNGEGQTECTSGWVVTKCGHFFHETCLVKWFHIQGGQRVCPKCGNFVPPKGAIKLSNGEEVMQDGHGEDNGLMGEASPLEQERPCCAFLIEKHDELVGETLRLRQRVRSLNETIRVKDSIIGDMGKERVRQLVEMDYQKRQIEEVKAARPDSPK